MTAPIHTLSQALPGSEVAQIVTDAASAASADLCPWHETGNPGDAARRQLWLETHAAWTAATADAARAYPWREDLA